MEVKYTVINVSNTSATSYSEQDANLAGQFIVKSQFNPPTDFIRAEYRVDNTVLQLDSDYKKYTIVYDSEFKDKVGASRIRISPEKDVKDLEYVVPQVDITYSFYRNLFNVNNRFQKLYIDSISENRSEIRLVAIDMQQRDVVALVDAVKHRLIADSTFSDFKILVDGYRTDLLAVNVATQTVSNQLYVVVKLYEPLPTQIQLKTKLQLVEEVSAKRDYSVLSETIQPKPTYKKLAGPNFTTSYGTESTTGTGYLSSVDLIDVNTYTSDVLEVLSRTSEGSVELSIDYEDYSNFIYFSSAVERLKNFVYKAQLIESYTTSLNLLPSISSSLESRTFYESRIQNIVKNFDHYERHLYFDSGSTSWPKQTSIKPYSLYSVSASSAVSWYSNQLEEAEVFDNTNYGKLTNTIPEYLREDEDNIGLLTFVDMLGQHFDNIKIYADSVSKKYNTDNRVDYGISKNIVDTVLENFGVKLYTNSSREADDLFKYFIITDEEVSSEVINTYSSVSDKNYSQEKYRQELYKRLYHNLPLLLKTKGTERSIKVLMSTFGIPSNLLEIKTYGGTAQKSLPYFGLTLANNSGSLDKVRLDVTGSVEGTVLSQNTSINKRNPDYQIDIHVVEVGPSPADNINRYILENIDPNFNIDQYLGDPRGYDRIGLNAFRNYLLISLERYDIKDFVRLIRFYDNLFFRMVRDFLPARDVVSTGIIIKPNLLEHNFVKDFEVDATNETLEVEIDTAFFEGSDAGVFGAKSDYTTSYTENIQAPDGIVQKPRSQNGYTLVGRHDGETPRYTGEFSGSEFKAAEKELNIDNQYKKPSFFDAFYNITPILDLNEIPVPDPVIVCCIPSFDSITDSGGNILLNFTLGSGTTCDTAVGVTYQTSTDGTTWVGTTTVGTTSPITITKPTESTYYRIRTECGTSSSSWTASRYYSVLSVCCVPTLNTLIENGSNLEVNYTVGVGGSCSITDSVSLQRSIDGGLTWNTIVAETADLPIVIPIPTQNVITGFRIISHCGTTQSSPSNVRNYIIPTSGLYLSDPAIYDGTTYRISGIDIYAAPGFSGTLQKSSEAWVSGFEQLGAKIYVNNTLVDGQDRFYVAKGTNFNTSTDTDWVFLQINSSGVVVSILDSNGNPL